jgi:hypothetical protein
MVVHVVFECWLAGGREMANCKTRADWFGFVPAGWVGPFRKCPKDEKASLWRFGPGEGGLP